MNLSCTVDFVISIPSIMSIIVIVVLHWILVMDTHLAMILTKNQEANSQEERTLLPLI